MHVYVLCMCACMYVYNVCMCGVCIYVIIVYVCFVYAHVCVCTGVCVRGEGSYVSCSFIFYLLPLGQEFRAWLVFNKFQKSAFYSSRR